MRLNIGFVDSTVVEKIRLASHNKKIPISQYIETIIFSYFESVKDDKIRFIPQRYTKIKERLNLTFKNKSLLKAINDFVERYQLSKSKLIEFIIKEHFMVNNTDNDLNHEIERYFDSTILYGVIDDELVKNTNKNKSDIDNKEPETQENKDTYSVQHLLYNSKHIDIQINANSISLDELNKEYLKELKDSFEHEIFLRSYSTKCQGFFYIALVKSAQLISRGTIYQPRNDTEQNKKTKLILTKRKNKYIYNFSIESIILNIGIIETEETNEKSKIVFTPFDQQGVLKRASKYIDLTSIEFVASKKQEKYKNALNYYRLLPTEISANGHYYIKLIDKPQSIKELVKKKNIYKIDKDSYIKKNPSYNLFPLLENKISIINLLPISQYTKHQRYTDKICYFENKKI